MSPTSCQLLYPALNCENQYIHFIKKSQGLEKAVVKPEMEKHEMPFCILPEWKEFGKMVIVIKISHNIKQV